MLAMARYSYVALYCALSVAILVIASLCRTVLLCRIFVSSKVLTSLLEAFRAYLSAGISLFLPAV